MCRRSVGLSIYRLADLSSVGSSVCMSLRRSVRLSVCRSIGISFCRLVGVRRSVNRPVGLLVRSVDLSVRGSVSRLSGCRLSVCRPVGLSVSQSIFRRSLRLSVATSVCQAVGLSGCRYIVQLVGRYVGASVCLSSCRSVRLSVRRLSDICRSVRLSGCRLSV